MGSPLTVSSTVQCGHLGPVTVSSSAKLTVGGNAVLLQSGVAGQPINSAACLNPIPPANPSGVKCSAVVSVLPVSLAQKLTVGGQPVVLDSLTGLTNGVPPGSLLAVAGQAKLTAV
jgi:hypothetical protein